jgi:hypothetical protein
MYVSAKLFCLVSFATSATIYILSPGDDNVTLRPYETNNPGHQWTMTASSIINRAVQPSRVLELKPPSLSLGRLVGHCEASVTAAADCDVGTDGRHRQAVLCRSWIVDYAPIHGGDAKRSHHLNNPMQRESPPRYVYIYIYILALIGCLSRRSCREIKSYSIKAKRCTSFIDCLLRG